MARVFRLLPWALAGGGRGPLGLLHALCAPCGYARGEPHLPRTHGTDRGAGRAGPRHSLHSLCSMSTASSSASSSSHTPGGDTSTRPGASNAEAADVLARCTAPHTDAATYQRLVVSSFDALTATPDANADPIADTLARRMLSHAQLRRGQRVLDLATGEHGALGTGKESTATITSADRGSVTGSRNLV